MNSALLAFAAIPCALIAAAVLAAARRHTGRDVTPLEHAAIAIGVQAAWAALTGDWWAGAAIGIALFVGREHAQAEARYIAAHGGSRRATPRLPELGALSPSVWRVGDVLDVAAPAAATLILAGVLYAAA
jgi:hypothetical protein